MLKQICYSVSFIEANGDEDRYGLERTDKRVAEKDFEAAQKSELRKGRSVALSEIVYARESAQDDWEVASVDMIDGA